MFYPLMKENDPKGEWAVVWLAATYQSKVTKRIVIPFRLLPLITKMTAEGSLPLSLRLSGQLMYGLCILLSLQVKYLSADSADLQKKLYEKFRTNRILSEAANKTIAKKNMITILEVASTRSTMSECISEFDDGDAEVPLAVDHTAMLQELADRLLDASDDHPDLSFQARRESITQAPSFHAPRIEVLDDIEMGMEVRGGFDPSTSIFARGAFAMPSPGGEGRVSWVGARSSLVIPSSPSVGGDSLFDNNVFEHSSGAITFNPPANFETFDPFFPSEDSAILHDSSSLLFPGRPSSIWSLQLIPAPDAPRPITEPRRSHPVKPIRVRADRETVLDRETVFHQTHNCDVLFFQDFPSAPSFVWNTPSELFNPLTGPSALLAPSYSRACASAVEDVFREAVEVSVGSTKERLVDVGWVEKPRRMVVGGENVSTTSSSTSSDSFFNRELNFLEDLNRERIEGRRAEEGGSMRRDSVTGMRPMGPDDSAQSVEQFRANSDNENSLSFRNSFATSSPLRFDTSGRAFGDPASPIGVGSEVDRMVISTPVTGNERQGQRTLEEGLDDLTLKMYNFLTAKFAQQPIWEFSSLTRKSSRRIISRSFFHVLVLQGTGLIEVSQEEGYKEIYLSAIWSRP